MRDYMKREGEKRNEKRRRDVKRKSEVMIGRTGETEVREEKGRGEERGMEMRKEGKEGRRERCGGRK